MKSIIRALLFTAFLGSGSVPVFAQLSDLHYLPPLKQRSTAFIDQLIYLSTPETVPFNVYVYQGTDPNPIETLVVSKSLGATYNPGQQDNGVTLLTDAQTGYVQTTAGLRF